MSKRLIASTCLVMVCGVALGTLFASGRLDTVPVNQISYATSEDETGADFHCLTVTGFGPDFQLMRDMRVEWISERQGPAVVQLTAGQFVRTFGETQGNISVRIRLLIDGRQVPIGGQGGANQWEFFIREGVQELPPVTLTWVATDLTRNELHRATVQWTVTDVSPGGSFDQDVCIPRRHLSVFHR